MQKDEILNKKEVVVKPLPYKRHDKGKANEVISTPIYSNLPFPSRLTNLRDETQYSKILKMITQLHVNIPFVEALAQVLKYA